MGDCGLFQLESVKMFSIVTRDTNLRFRHLLLTYLLKTITITLKRQTSFVFS